MGDHEEREAAFSRELAHPGERLADVLILIGVRAAGQVGHERVDDHELGLHPTHGLPDRGEVVQVRHAFAVLGDDAGQHHDARQGCSHGF